MNARGRERARGRCQPSCSPSRRTHRLVVARGGDERAEKLGHRGVAALWREGVWPRGSAAREELHACMLGATMHACAAREVELHGRCAARAPRDATRRRGHCHWLGALGTVGAVGVCLCRRRCPSGALPAAPDGVRAGGDRADLRGRERHVAEHAQVARHHLDLAIDAILDAVGRAELLHLLGCE